MRGNKYVFGIKELQIWKHKIKMKAMCFYEKKKEETIPIGANKLSCFGYT